MQWISDEYEGNEIRNYIWVWWLISKKKDEKCQIGLFSIFFVKGSNFKQAHGFVLQFFDKLQTFLFFSFSKKNFAFKIKFSKQTFQPHQKCAPFSSLFCLFKWLLQCPAENLFKKRLYTLMLRYFFFMNFSYHRPWSSSQ